MMRAVLRLTMFAVLAIAVVTLSLFLLSRMGVLDDIFGTRRTQRSALEVLSSEEILFLVTERVTTLVYVEITESNLLTGNREGFLIAPVRFYYGIDLDKLAADSIERSGDSLIVRLPAPEILELAPLTNEFRFFSKRSGILFIADIITGYDMEEDLVSLLDSTSRVQALELGLLPSRDDLVRRLTGYAPILTEYIGVESIEFR